ncbi:hypothetical protein PFFCH_00624 [Plasmodium falciparum FCH/4]|uniref:Mitochondrial carrier protein n=3 Tax=Plasmodium falciparum TaxID=5833 RepID=A0A024VU45_PLAFA|nr:hypothetical protein PFFVO_03696 [Plasmodium falciparum Vietnam Oak-Knoll (FVO)]ETW31972.1 hypothetical protein PFFCH_00624 [Plasmodium falciparum FCH/4]ETW47932.1 hypothetical protein PFMALIP_03967 [Plasmodium falciparum MaliPS096_E11]
MEHLKNLITGAISGAIVDAVLFPIDYIKTNIQTNNSFSIYDPRKLYNGILPTLIGTVPASAFFYCFYELSKKLLTETIKDISKGGFLSFYKGCYVRASYLCFGGMIFFGCLRFFSF